MSFDLQALVSAVTYVSYNVTKALLPFIQRDSFLFWPFLVSAAVIAIVMAVFAGADPGSPHTTRWRALRKRYSTRPWLHRSARADYRLYFANALILPLIFGVALFTDAHVVSTLNSALGRAAAGGMPAPDAAASLASRAMFTLLFFIAYDFGRFVAHSLLHDVPVLWEFHKVHHSAETLNPTTTFRAHPLELLIMAWVPAVLTGLVTWTFNQFVASKVGVYTFLGLHVLIFATNLVGILRHSHVWLHYGPRWGKWLISPAHHQVHHSCEERHHRGVNRGFELAVWDRLYGTLYVPQRQESFRMGLGDDTDGEWHSSRRMYVMPFVNAARGIDGYARRRRVSASGRDLRTDESSRS
jgi:sterol desaturase/sphingolipid hydroxylase (fatty acid hydroxylase superfamily)